MKRFTLIELLVVVAIIGILASILLPSISSARLKTIQAYCLNSQKQVALASVSYATDYNEYMPSYTASGDHWTQKIMVGNYLDIPSDGSVSKALKCPLGAEQESESKTNVSMNKRLTGSEFGPDAVSIVKATETQTLMLIDAYKWWKQADSTQMDASKIFEDVDPSYNIARHQLKANVIYLDGHGLAKTIAFLLSKNDETATFWDPEQ
ncbi:MAG: type II secretion system GspH family protein [Lentisphaeraceae bacterium]|nr:type II secretion system GspH family protein [Lentisphaeraceae bacterium]